MEGILSTIIPIVLVLTIGWAARKKGFIPTEFLVPGNRLVYYLAIPAMVFRAITRGGIDDHFHPLVLALTLVSVAGAYFSAFGVCKLKNITAPRAGTFIQSAGHGNQGHISLPVAFYLLGDAGLAKAGIIAGFVMILQNILSVSFLQLYQTTKRSRSIVADILIKLSRNPVIIAAMSGMLVAFFHIPLPFIVQRTIDMLGNMAPPLALLLIGASLSTSGMRTHFRQVMGAVSIKLILLPAIGILLYRCVAGLPVTDFLPGLILLICPTAALSFVMAREIGGDPDFAVSSISTSTLLSIFTMATWLMIAHWMEAG
ncbi:AEC family transporter [Desulfosarcina sp. OttesenSCG-928-B08]|nr:AEC family transporter [Desulfosarcina sp. OttesenSCG-928-B08]